MFPTATKHGPVLVPSDASIPPLAGPEFVLPVLTRSAGLLNVLLQDNAVDLDLASSVAALDPGLAFGILQLANAEFSDREPVWQLPAAVVAAGREPLQQFIDCAPRVELRARPDPRKRLPRLAHDAVVLGCVAHLLARELGRCHPRKSFLGGLLLAVPEMAGFVVPQHDGYKPRLLSVMCRSLPSGIVKAAMADPSDDAVEDDPLVATILLAQAVLREKADGASGEGGFAALADAPLWRCWPGVLTGQRVSLLNCCSAVADWAGWNLYRTDPWEFMAKVERAQPCE